MSNALQALASPFEVTAPEEDIELRALARSLRFSRGFRLFFARSQDADERRRLVEALGGAIPSAPPLEVHFDRPIAHLLDELRRRLPATPPPFIFVWGLESSLPRAAEAHATALVGNLNAARDSFPQYIPCPLLLWVQPYALTAIARGAPDFFSIRSGVYDFATARHHPPGLADSLSSTENWELANLPPAEKLERVEAVSELLARYQTLPLEQRDRQSESRLLNRLGNLLDLLGRWSEEVAVLQQALEIDREVGDRAGEGQTLNNLGNVYESQGRWDKALVAYRESLAIKREFKDRAGEGRALNNLGNVYRSQGRWDEALIAHSESLAIKREFKDRAGEGRASTTWASYTGRKAGGTRPSSPTARAWPSSASSRTARARGGRSTTWASCTSRRAGGTRPSSPTARAWPSSASSRTALARVRRSRIWPCS